MSKEENTVMDQVEVPVIQPKESKGMTIDEIRYQRALMALKKEFCKERVIRHKNHIIRSSPFSKGYKPAPGSPFGRTGAIVTKLLGGLNYLDYVMAGVSIFQTGKKLFGIFRGKGK